MKRRMEPPKHEQPPDDEWKVKMAEACCDECVEVFGPRPAEDIGMWIMHEHRECHDIKVEEWIETWSYDENRKRVITVDSDR